MEDTIYALSTAPTEGGIAIIRISGEKALPAILSVFRPAAKDMPDHMLRYGYIYDGDERVDEAMGVYMAAPKTYTGEDVCELHIHGSMAIASRALGLLSRMEGLRTAMPGEFTKRAFLSGRIDLARAESVMDMISAKSEKSAAVLPAIVRR